MSVDGAFQQGGHPDVDTTTVLDVASERGATATFPARGYTITHPPFEEGNTAALRHGARSPRMVEPVARALLDHLAETAPWTAAPSFSAVRRAWAWAEAQSVLLRAWVDDKGLLDDEGEALGALGQLDRVERRAATLRAELGLTPASLVRLLSGLSSIDAPAALGGLDALKAAGRDLRLAADHRAALATSGTREAVAELAAVGDGALR